MRIIPFLSSFVQSFSISFKINPQYYYNNCMNAQAPKRSRPIFYRGISLKDYLRKSSLIHQNLQYPDDETIFVDQNKVPVFIDDSFIITEPYQAFNTQTRTQTKHSTQNLLPAQKSNIQLPTLRDRKYDKTQTKSHTDRNSTDASMGSSFDLRLSILPEIQKRELSREKNNMPSSRNQNRRVSLQKKQTQAKDLQQVEEEPISTKGRPHITREYTQYIKKQMMLKHRYNLQGQVKARNSKIREINRVKSYAQ